MSRCKGACDQCIYSIQFDEEVELRKTSQKKKKIETRRRGKK